MQFPHLPAAEDGAENIEFSWRHASALYDAREVSSEHMRMSYQRGGQMVATRDPASVVIEVPQPLSIAAIVHPIATLPLSVFARWHGHMTLHGGAFLNAGAAWAICGDQTAGKSSALAMLGSRGVPILSDDLVVIAGHEVLCGPRCVDLRPDVAARFANAESLGVVGSRERFRLPTAEAPPRAPLGGIVVLEWGTRHGDRGDSARPAGPALAALQAAVLDALRAARRAGRDPPVGHADAALPPPARLGQRRGGDGPAAGGDVSVSVLGVQPGLVQAGDRAHVGVLLGPLREQQLGLHQPVVDPRAVPRAREGAR